MGRDGSEDEVHRGARFIIQSKFTIGFHFGMWTAAY